MGPSWGRTVAVGSLILAAVIMMAITAGCSRKDTYQAASHGQQTPSQQTLGAARETPSEAATGTAPGPVPDTLPQTARNVIALRWGMQPAGDGRQPMMEVTDERIVGALAAQLARAEPIEKPPAWSYDEYVLQFRLSGGGETEPVKYYIKGPTMALPGYIKFHEDWYEVPAQLGAMLSSLDEYRPAGAGIGADDERFLAEYGWTPFFLISEFEMTLPGEFVHRPGEFPSVLYWAYNNELNKDIGMDLSPYLGQKVYVRLYKVAELLPDFMKPRRERGRAVIVLRDGEVVGAWLDVGRHHAFACSLSGRRLEDITGKTWDEWIPAVIDADDAVERELASLTAEEVIRRYFDAIDRGDYPAALACLTRKHLLSYLFSNMDNRGLYNPGFDQELWGMRNTTSAKVESIKRMEGASAPEGCVMYQVMVNLTVKQPITHGSGRQPRFVSLRRETPKTGWRIDGIGTGP